MLLYGNVGGSFHLRQTALNAGFREGVKQGREDRRKRTQGYFREAYEHGYADGYAG